MGELLENVGLVALMLGALWVLALIANDDVDSDEIHP